MVTIVLKSVREAIPGFLVKVLPEKYHRII